MKISLLENLSLNDLETLDIKSKNQTELFLETLGIKSKNQTELFIDKYKYSIKLNKSYYTLYYVGKIYQLKEKEE